MERDTFDRKDCYPSVWCKCRNRSTIKTEKEFLCWQEVEAVRNFILQVIFVLYQAIIFVAITEAVARRCSVEKMFLEILRNF